MRSIVLILALMGGSTVGQAQEAAAVESSQSLNKEVQAEPQKKILAAASLRESSNMIAPGSHGHENQTELDLTLGRFLGDWGKIAINQGLSKSHQQEETLDLTNTKIGFSHIRVSLHRDVGILDVLYAKLPANRVTREKDKLMAAAGIENYIDLRLGQGPIFILNRLILNRNFHQYTVNSSGVPTVEWSLNEGVTVSSDIAKIVKPSIDFSYLTSRTYNGTTKSRLDISEELEFPISHNLSFSLGHTNGEALVRSTERSSNVQAFDQATSTVYGAFNAIY